jgi:hypothetical protein
MNGMFLVRFRALNLKLFLHLKGRKEEGINRFRRLITLLTRSSETLTAARAAAALKRGDNISSQIQKKKAGTILELRAL